MGCIKRPAPRAMIVLEVFGRSLVCFRKLLFGDYFLLGGRGGGQNHLLLIARHHYSSPPNYSTAQHKLYLSDALLLAKDLF